jgi:hypothetical protein
MNMRLEDHPTVRRLEASRHDGTRDATPATIGAEELSQLALDCGAADAGLVEIARPAPAALVASSSMPARYP